MSRIDPARLMALIAKEAIQIRRDPSTFLIAFLLPVMLLFLFGFAVSLDSTRIRVALILQDGSPAATRLASAYVGSPSFAVTTLRTVAAAGPAMADGSIRGIIVIPEGFGRSIAGGRPLPIQIITDGSQPNLASFVAAYGEGVRAAWAAGAGAQSGDSAVRGGIGVSARYWYNPGLRSSLILVPGAIAIVMTMIGTLLTALVVAREWERGTMEAILATPMRMTEFILSKIIPYFALAMVSMAGCTLLAITVFDVPFRGSVLALLALTSAFLLPALGLGLFISSVTRSQFVASQVALLGAFLPTFLLSGFLFEIASMPAPIRAVTYAVAARYFIPSLQTVFLVGDVWPLFLPNIAILLAFGGLFFFLSFRVTRRQIG